MSKKHKKNATNNGNNDQSKSEHTIVSESDLNRSIKAMESVIETSGLTEDDLRIFKSRLAIAKEKLESIRRTRAIEEEQIKAYAKAKADIERRIADFETLVNGDLSSQDLIDAAREMKAKIDLSELNSVDADALRIRKAVANDKLEEVEDKIKAEKNAYAQLKSQIENQMAEFESLVEDGALPILNEQKTEEKVREVEVKVFQNEEKSERIIHHNAEKLINKKSYNNIAFGIFIALILGSYSYSYQKNNITKKPDLIKASTEKYIKENLIQAGTDFEIKEFVKEGDLYRFSATVGGQNIISYVTADGKKLLLNPIDLDKADSNAAGASAQAAPSVSEASTKKDVPDVELFVMSQCPYGVQAEKGILPVIQKLASKINFDIKFVDYTLHGKKEFDENLNQYCIQKEASAKFNDYLACYVKSGDAEACATTAKIDSAKISSCVSDTDKKFKLTESFVSSGSSPFNIYKDLNTKYGVQGSPSLVVNGQLLESGRDSASLLKTICSGFSTQPEECKASLSSASPTPGFGN